MAVCDMCFGTGYLECMYECPHCVNGFVDDDEQWEMEHAGEFEDTDEE